MKVARSCTRSLPLVLMVALLAAVAQPGDAEQHSSQPEEADLEPLRQRANAGEEAARFELGRRYLRGTGVPRDLTRARALLEPGARAGHPDSMGAYGVMLARGLGVEKDETAGFAMVRQAAEAGVLTAVMNQGIMTLRGQGTNADAAAGLALLEKAADQGLVEAQVRLAEAHYFGEEGRIGRSPEKAAPWALKAAEAGSAWAQNLLGTMAEHGMGRPRDRKQAFDWYQKSAEQGEPKAQSALGRLLHGGLDVPRDRIASYYWLQASAAQGEVTAIKFLEETADGWSTEEINEAKKRLKESPPKTILPPSRLGPGPPVPRQGAVEPVR